MRIKDKEEEVKSKNKFIQEYIVSGLVQKETSNEIIKRIEMIFTSG